MLCSALDFLQLVVEPALQDAVLVGLEFLQCLVLLEGGDIGSELIDECACSVLDEVVDGDQHVQVLPCFFEVVLEDSDSLDGQVDYLLEGLEVEGQRGQLVEFIGGNDLLGREDHLIDELPGGGTLV